MLDVLSVSGQTRTTLRDARDSTTVTLLTPISGHLNRSFQLSGNVDTKLGRCTATELR